MTSRPYSFWHSPELPSFMEHLYRGELRWDLVQRFPRQEAEDRAAGDRVLAGLAALLKELVDPAEVDASRQLPAGLLDALVKGGYDKLQADPAVGGLGLSHMNTFRVIETAASWSMPVAQVLSIQNTIGAGPFLPSLPPGALRDAVEARTAAGVFSGNADTEPQGAANRKRDTIATPVEDGAAFLLNGEKVFTGNGPIAGILTVTATVRGADRDRVRLFFVDADSPGFKVDSWHEFMGLKGFPAGALSFTNVRVPADMVMAEEEHNRRLTPELSRRIMRGRVHTIAAPSLAYSRLCLHWSREFANRRRMDGRELGSYDEVRWIVADTLAEVFALETLSRWCLLTEDLGHAVNPRYEQVAAKNLSSMTAWRTVERTLSLYGGEGYENERSKARRGVPPVPVERALREIRGLRVSGGVDFQMDNWMAQVAVFWCYYPEPENADAIMSGDPDLSCLDSADLTEPNLAHLRFAVSEAKTFARTCLELARRYPDSHNLFEREHLVISLNQVANELLLISVVLARASSEDASGSHGLQDLADIYCAAARLRIAEAWRRVESADTSVPTEAARQWLRGERWDDLLADVVTDLPSTGPKEKLS